MCEHKDGWIIKDSEVINIGQDDDFEVDVTCNTTGCGEERKLKISCYDIQEF